MRPILLYLKVFVIFFGILLFAATAIFAQNQNNKISVGIPVEIKPFERKAFIENKGQFQQSLPADKQNFNFCIDKGYQIFFYQNEISYLFTKHARSKGTILNIFESEEKREEREHTFKTETQFINVKWLNSNPNSTIIVEDKQTTYYSYVINSSDPHKNEKPNTVMCDGYSKLVYKNLYDGIDVEYIFHPDNGIKYNLIIHPGGDISKVQMQYIGTNGIFEKGGDIHIKTIFGDIIDHAPITFYANNKEKITSSFTINKNIISFNVSPYLKDQEVIIDPWTLVPAFTSSNAYDNGVDNFGNIYIYGGTQNNFVVEKYGPSGGAPIWSLANTGIDQSYYGDMLVEGNGNFYLSEGFVGAGARTYKFSPTSSSTWQSTSDPNFREHWRLALNCATNKVIIAGGGTTSPTLNIAEIDVNTGVLVNAKSVFNQSQSDVAGLCVDEVGKAYLKHSNPNIITFTDNLNNTLANIPDGYNLSEVGIGGTPSYYPVNFTNGYNFMTLGGATFLFTTDGSTIKKWDRNTQAMISSVNIPGGQQNLGSGILADSCNNLFVGASNGVYRFDFNLVQKEFQATTAAVYDIAYALNSDIVACGNGFLKTLPFGRESCGSTTIIVTTDPCDPEINTVNVMPGATTSSYSVFWDDGSSDTLRTNLSLGIHIVTIRRGECNPTFTTDTVKISDDFKALTVQKTNPWCTLSSDGDITVTLLSNQVITNVVWTPAITNSQLNDSTTKATGLPSGSYSCHIVSDLGCSFDTTITLAAVNFNPDVAFSSIDVCDGAAMPFTDNSTTGSGVLASWAWSFGDSSPLTLTQNPSHIYTSTGTFPVTLIVKTDVGCSDTITKNVIVHPLPDAQFSTNNVCKGSIVTFTDLSSIPGTDIIQIWSWNFGDGSPVTNNQNTLHLYSALGSYTSQLLVSSNFGCKDSITKTVTINPNPIVNFSAPDTVGCDPLCVNFQNSVSIASGTNISYSWNFGDGSALGASSNAEHCYTNNSVFLPMTFNVSLTVTSDSGCITSLIKNNYIIVNPNPIANFTVQPDVASIVDPVITFANLSSGANAWNWNFGDLTTSTLSDPLPHAYPDTAKYLITLIVSNQYSCFDTTYKTITIEPDWAFFVPNVFSPNADGINDSFQGYGFGLLKYEMVIFDRWGNEIYRTKDYNYPWDGTANNGKYMAQQDVYVYLINIRDVKGKDHSYKGIVTLVK